MLLHYNSTIVKLTLVDLCFACVMELLVSTKSSLSFSMQDKMAQKLQGWITQKLSGEPAAASDSRPASPENR